MLNSAHSEYSFNAKSFLLLGKRSVDGSPYENLL